MAGNRGRQTIRGMIQSMAVIGIVVAGIYMLVPHDENADPIKEQDYRVELLTARRAAPYPIAAPEGLGTGWKATSVRFDGADAHAWHLGFLDPDRQYVAVKQSSAEPRDKYVREVTHEARPTKETRTVGERTWQRWEGPKYDALVLTADGATTVVLGTASEDRLAEMAGALVAERGEKPSAAPSAS
ncbi:DUF4245 domain-containing protein [Streptomyces sp. NPDC005805]|uniref:DUF4245 domain-containing protein n=1 Tax=Streptomyces sp. NPDC005805 TaxID=3157068 RepID=UPI0033D7D070